MITVYGSRMGKACQRLIRNTSLEEEEKEEQQMVSFESDYTKGAHPKILKRLAESNLEPMPGYGMDSY